MDILQDPTIRPSEPTAPDQRGLGRRISASAAGRTRQFAIWQVIAGRPLGKLILALCPNSRTECTNSNCALQPFCACARADLKAAAKIESRVWLALAVCAALLLLVVSLRPLLR